MSRLVEECRSEWRRLGVPEAIADEMAAELEADLEEAASEGGSAEDVLGAAAFHPRSLAAAWAAERSVVPRPSQHGRQRSWPLAAAIAAFALVAIAGAVLVVLASPSKPARLAVEAPVAVSPDGQTAVRYVITPGGDAVAVPTPSTVAASLPSSGPFLATRAPGVQIVTAEAEDSSADMRIVGAVLLAAGLAGLVPLALLSLRLQPARV